jgi:hypothetical protein
MDTRSILNNKIRKTRIRVVVYVLMLMMLQAKIKACTIVKYKRSGSLTFTVSRFLFFCCNWVDAIKSVIKDKYGFISMDLNCQRYKSEPFVLAKHVTQMFYFLDTTNKRLKLVIPVK